MCWFFRRILWILFFVSWRMRSVYIVSWGWIWCCWSLFVWCSLLLSICCIYKSFLFCSCIFWRSGCVWVIVMVSRVRSCLLSRWGRLRCLRKSVNVGRRWFLFSSWWLRLKLIIISVIFVIRFLWIKFFYKVIFNVVILKKIFVLSIRKMYRLRSFGVRLLYWRKSYSLLGLS